MIEFASSAVSNGARDPSRSSEAKNRFGSHTSETSAEMNDCVRKPQSASLFPMLLLLMTLPAGASNLEDARKEASAAGKPMMVVFRCVP